MFAECNCSANTIELVYIVYMVKCIVLIFALHHVYQKILQSEVIELEKNSCMKKSHCQSLKHTTVKLTNFLLCLLFPQSVTK